MVVARHIGVTPPGSTVGAYPAPMGNFEVVGVETSDRLDRAVFREVGSVVASYLARTDAQPVAVALRDALDEPPHHTQILNLAIGFANVVALLALSVTREEAAAADVVRGTLRLGNGGEDPDAELLILRVLDPSDTAPEAITGANLVALANYADTAVRLTDRLGIPREPLASAVAAAAARMG